MKLADCARRLGYRHVEVIPWAEYEERQRAMVQPRVAA